MVTARWHYFDKAFRARVLPALAVNCIKCTRAKACPGQDPSRWWWVSWKAMSIKPSHARLGLAWTRVKSLWRRSKTPIRGQRRGWGEMYSRLHLKAISHLPLTPQCVLCRFQIREDHTVTMPGDGAGAASRTSSPRCTATPGAEKKAYCAQCYVPATACLRVGVHAAAWRFS